MSMTPNYGFAKRGLGQRLPSSEYANNWDILDTELQVQEDGLAAETTARIAADVTLHATVTDETADTVAAHTALADAHHPADSAGIAIVPASIHLAGDGQLAEIKNGASDGASQAKWVLRASDNTVLAHFNAAGELFVKKLTSDGPTVSNGSLETQNDALVADDLTVNGDTVLGDNPSLDTLLVKALTTLQNDLIVQKGANTFTLTAVSGAAHIDQDLRLAGDEIRLNEGGTAGDASFVVKRGASPDAKIRWNEATTRWEYTSDGGSTWKFFGEIADSSSNGRYKTNAQLTYISAGVYDFPESFVANTEVINVNTTTKVRGIHYDLALNAGVMQATFVIGHVPDTDALVYASYQQAGSTTHAVDIVDQANLGTYAQASSSPGADCLRITNGSGDFDKADMPAEAMTLVYRWVVPGTWTSGTTIGGIVTSIPTEGLVIDKVVICCRTVGSGDTQITLNAGTPGTAPTALSTLGTAGTMTLPSAGGNWQKIEFTPSGTLILTAPKLLTLDIPFVGGTGQADLTVDVWGHRNA